MLLSQVDQNHEAHKLLVRLIVISTCIHVLLFFSVIGITYKNAARIIVADYEPECVVVMPLYKTIKQPQKQSQKAVLPQKNVSLKKREYFSATARASLSTNSIKTPKLIEKSISEKTTSKKVEPDFPATPYIRKKRETLDQAKIIEKESSTQAELTQLETVYLGRDDYAAYERSSQIKKAILEYWHPASFAHAKFCEVLVDIDEKGIKKQVSIIQSSGIPALDSAARMAAMKAQFPKNVWNSRFTLVFGS